MTAPQYSGPFSISEWASAFKRRGDGSITIYGGNIDDDGAPVLNVVMTVRAKRREAWKTQDPDQEAFADHVVALLNANPFKGAK